MNNVSAEKWAENAENLEVELARLMVGQKDLVGDVLLAIFCGGHVLLEGVPGLGKTVLVKALSQVFDLAFSRVQFTPDLMPADITGTHIVNEDENGRRSFEFQQGPLFANIVLADEINRATPKTQSALLEAMQEKQITVGDRSRPLPDPFFVLATQNPLELEGTYPLPEAQLDRFFFKLIVRFPKLEELMEIAKRTTGSEVINLKNVANGEDLKAMHSAIKEVPVANHVMEYAARMVLATHPENADSDELVKKYVRWGTSPRGLQSLLSGSRARALRMGRYQVGTEDIQVMAKPSLRHRIFMNFEADADGILSDQIVDHIVESLKIPQVRQ